jgi:non-specific protein-tyrosine kinase
LFDVRELAGLTNVVMRQSTLDEALVPIRLLGSEPATSVSVAGSSRPGRLSVLPSGPLPANPGEFVAAEALVTRVLEPLQKRFDYVIVDAPPMCVGGDATILSGKVDSLVVVARLGVIDRPALADLGRQLSAIPKPAIGFVVTGVDTPGGAYGYGAYSSNGEEPRSEHGPPTEEPRSELRLPTDEDTAVAPRRARS